MSTTSAPSTTTSDRSHRGPSDVGTTTFPATAWGGGRYRPGRAVSRHDTGGLWNAHDTRLGRAVLMRCDAGSGSPARLVAVDHPAVAPVLDAGEDLGAGGVAWSWTVFPATDWLPFDALPTVDLAAVDTAGLAAAAAWLVAATVHTRSVRGNSVALSSDAVVLDLRWLAGALPADGCPVRWMPAPAPGADDDLTGVVDRLGTAVRRRDRRRWNAAVSPLAATHGRRRAVRLLAGLAGLDPHGLGLTPLAPHHAGRERRPFGRRSPVGTVPTTTRKELACESVEASS